MAKYKTIPKSYKWINCYYIWFVKNRFVLYDWHIKEDLWNNVKCIMIDQYIYANKEPFEIILPKNKINITK